MIHRGVDNRYTLGTIYNSISAGSWEDYYIEKPIASVHSHPNTVKDYSLEVESMGYWGKMYLPQGDWKNVIKDQDKNGINYRRSYVYFPDSRHLYFVGYERPYYIRTVTSYRSFYFGVLNHR